MCVHYYTQLEKQKSLEDLQNGWGSSAVVMLIFILVFIFSCDFQIFYNELKIPLDNVNDLYREACFH